ncbi:MAG: GHMP kinase [Dehalococcoidia bacterium]|nr:GHMP kinase [Dehalococcoidia bacterium]
MTVRCRAPLRISFGGGGTDVPPYPEEKGGAVLSTTIGKYAYCTLVPRDDDQISVTSLDYDIVASYSVNSELKYDGNLDLVKAAIQAMGVSSGCNLFLHTDAPPGSGLGTSSALVVAIVGAFKRWLRLPLTGYDIAEMAYRIERVQAGIKGGRQDQYAATFGGFNFIEFLGKTTIVNPLRIDWDTINELEYRLMLCYTGGTRISAGILDDQVSGYVEGREDVLSAFAETKQLAFDMKNALLLGKLNELGSLLHRAWCCKKRLSSKISDPRIDELYELARKNGAIGGKLLGAGGGGYLLFLCEFDKWHIVAEKLERAGGKIVGFTFDLRGMQSWEVTES